MFKLGSKVGRIGEDTACVFLMKRGFSIVDRNYWKKWGEIDIVAERDGVTRFIEVKSVSRESLDDVSDETGHRPEDNVHPMKLKRMRRVIQTYLAEKGIGEEGRWQSDVAAVYLDHANKKAKVRLVENVLL